MLIALVGLSFIAVGLIPRDPAPGYDPAGLALHAPKATGLMHLSIAGVAAGCSVASLIVMAARLARDPAWVGLAGAARLTALLVVGCIVIYGIWGTRSTGLAGTFERLAIVLPIAWNAAFLRRLGAGAPFVVAGV